MSEARQSFDVFETAFGYSAIAWNDVGVTRFVLPAAAAAAAEKRLKRRTPNGEPGQPPPAVADAIARIRRYFTGEPEDLSAVPVDLGDQDPFFARIYDAVRRVGWGRTTTYGALAAALGAPREAARDVGQAMARNPTPLIIPCHRVLAAGGKIGGFSAPGGANMKARMLRMEGVEFAAPETAQRAFAL